MCVFSMVGGCKYCENREQCNAALKKLLEPEIKKMFEIIAETIKERNSENDKQKS